MNSISPSTILKLINMWKFRFKGIRNSSHSSTKTPPWNVLFFGTDDFSIYSLKDLYSEYKKGEILNNLEVVTTTSGKWNPVRKFSEKHKLCVHSWPEQMPENTFDVGLVVSFGHLIPESVIKRFNYGMLNVHASLLPRWRGAAPMIYALANGDKETGVTIMRIRPKHFDIGEIIMQDKVCVPDDMRLQELHKSLGKLGAKCLVQCLKNLPDCLKTAKPQPDTGVTFAPKVNTQFAVIRWEKMCSAQIYNLDRAVDGLFSLTSSWNGIPVKLVGISVCGLDCDIDNDKPGFVIYDKKHKLIKVICASRTCIQVERLGIYGKKVMSASDFNNGYLKKEPLDRRYFV